MNNYDHDLIITYLKNKLVNGDNDTRRCTRIGEGKTTFSPHTHPTTCKNKKWQFPLVFDK